MAAKHQKRIERSEESRRSEFWPVRWDFFVSNFPLNDTLHKSVLLVGNVPNYMPPWAISFKRTWSKSIQISILSFKYQYHLSNINTIFQISVLPHKYLWNSVIFLEICYCRFHHHNFLVKAPLTPDTFGNKKTASWTILIDRWHHACNNVTVCKHVSL